MSDPKYAPGDRVEILDIGLAEGEAVDLIEAFEAVRLDALVVSVVDVVNAHDRHSLIDEATSDLAGNESGSAGDESRFHTMGLGGTATLRPNNRAFHRLDVGAFELSCK